MNNIEEIMHRRAEGDGCRSSFQHVHPYAVDIPSFGCPWGFNVCYNSCAWPDAPNWDAATVDKKLAEALADAKRLFRRGAPSA